MRKIIEGSLELAFFDYGEPLSQALAGAFYAAASEEARAALLWDSPRESLPGRWLEQIAACGGCGFASLDGRPVGVCWLTPLSAGCEGWAALHMFAPASARKSLYASASRFLQAGPAMRYQGLLAFIPVIYTPTIDLLKRLGFKFLSRLPNACWLEARQERCDGKLLILNRAPAWRKAGRRRIDSDNQITG